MKDYSKIELNSDKSAIHEVEQFIEFIADKYNITNTYFGNMAIAITEAISNSIEHGNKNDVNKKISLEFYTETRGLIFKITDEGNGFDINSISDPTDINNSDSSKGRGIFLMKSLADDIIFNELGNSIELIFSIASINAELAARRMHQLNAYSKSIFSTSTLNK